MPLPGGANAAAVVRVMRDDDRTAPPFASPPYGNQRDGTGGRRLRQRWREAAPLTAARS
jgi:hypothetical protein